MTEDLRPATRSAAVALLTALAYAAVGWLALRLLIPPHYASAIYPSAGIALAAAVVYGRPALVGVALGALAVNAGLMFERGPVAATDLAAAAAIALGATAQAALGRHLVRRHVGQPLVLAEPADLVRFYVLGAPLACLVSATVATAALLAAGWLTPSLATSSWSVWWVGDTLGVLVAAPIALTLIGRPRAEWAARRWVVALPMLLTASLLAAAVTWVVRSHEHRLRSEFERDAWRLADRLDARLRGPLDALQAMHGLFDSQQKIEPDEMTRAAAPWLRNQPYVTAIGYSERVDPADVPAFEARGRAEGPAADYRVFDRGDEALAPSGYGVLAIRYIEPLAPNRAALGVNSLSIRAARLAIQRAAATGELAATSGFRLTQAAGDDETGVVLYQALYRGAPRTDAERRAAFTGAVFVTLRLDALIDNLFRDAPEHLSWCLVDLDPGAERPRLAGPPGCEARPAGALHYARAWTLGPRALQWRADADPARMPGLAAGGGWLFAAVGLLATALLGALLLTVSGRQRRIEAAVEARTAELRRAGQALRLSEGRLRSVVNHVPIGIFYTDAGGRVRETNPSLRQMVGEPSSGAAGPTLLDWIDAADRPSVAQWLESLVQGQRGLARGRVNLLHAQGRKVPVQLALTAQRDGEGVVRRLVGVAEDISEHLQLEASERSREQAEAANRAKSEFVGRMSHELRTPLNAMLGFAQLLAHDRSPALVPHQQRWASQIQDAGWHLLNMINDTLDLSIIESGTLRLQPRALDPAALLQATLPLVADAAERRQVRVLPPRTAQDAGPAWGDETRVRQILTNLLSNAIKYNVGGGRVEVGVTRAGADTVAFTVHDTGIGMRADQVEALFQPFNRLGREGSGVEGTGIGLVISRRLAELMGGRLTLHSRVGEGSTFVLTLPSATASATPVEDAAPPADDSRYHRRRVLYVEDNETNVVLMQGMLGRRPQIELATTPLGMEALTLLRRGPRPDLILLDMHLPDIDGLALLRMLKQDAATAAIPVLVLSADATAERVEAALREGAAGYLPKPIDLGELLRTVDALLEQAETRWG